MEEFKDFRGVVSFSWVDGEIDKNPAHFLCFTFSKGVFSLGAIVEKNSKFYVYFNAAMLHSAEFDTAEEAIMYLFSQNGIEEVVEISRSKFEAAIKSARD